MKSAAIVRAAMTGILLGAATSCGGQQQEPTKNPQAVTIPAGSADESSPDPHAEATPVATRPRENPNCCAGKNECKGLGGCAIAGASECAGKNACKGMGGCKNRQCPVADERVGDCCKGMNECKGKGGCKTDNNDCAGKNECKGKGGCRSFCPR